MGESGDPGFGWRTTVATLLAQFSQYSAAGLSNFAAGAAPDVPAPTPHAAIALAAPVMPVVLSASSTRSWYFER